MTMSKQDIKEQLANYKPTEDERVVIKSALFQVITLSTVGAASLGISGHLWNKSRPRPTGIPSILGFFTGLALGAALGMDKGMRTLRNSLPPDSHLLYLIHANDAVRREMLQSLEKKNDD